MDVLAMRRQGMSYVEIGKEFGAPIRGQLARVRYALVLEPDDLEVVCQ